MSILPDFSSLKKSTLLKVVIPILIVIALSLGSAAAALRVETSRLSDAFSEHCTKAEVRFTGVDARTASLQARQASVSNALHRLEARQDEVLWYLAKSAGDRSAMREIQARRQARATITE